MSNLPYVKSFKELTAYIKAMDLADQIFDLTLSFPRSETYSLTDQIRRSSRSIGAQIAEAWGKRIYIKHFISKLTDAYAETYETEHWIIVANRCGYISDEMKHSLNNDCIKISQLLGGMIRKADRFCK